MNETVTPGNDRQLYERFLSGNSDAVCEMVKKYSDSLILFLNGILKDPAASEEISSETFFKLIVKHPKYRGEASFKTYLFSIGRNLAVDHLRKVQKEEVFSEEQLLENIKETENIEETVLKNERDRELYSALDRLQPDYSEALYLTYFNGLSAEDVGKVMKKSRKQVENLLYRAKLSLKKILLKDGFNYEIV
ncbi:MAG: sigma-70 family RNA polymerase sigma factor [Oscillospiraceae bacterium]|nr:sigma-70 family RNA polymerase sigma factor [Oscillospiraceae bacterium]